jgi:hypothetical protein
MANTPITTATKLNEGNFIPMIKGTANKTYLPRMELNPIIPALALDLNRVMGMVCPNKTKLMTLKIAPMMRPLATAVCFKRRHMTAITVEQVIAQVQIFLGVISRSLLGLVMLCLLLFLLPKGFHNITVNRITPARNSQQDKKGNKEALCVEPFIQMKADGKAKKNRPNHG